LTRHEIFKDCQWQHRRFSGWHPAVVVVCAAILTWLIYDRWSRPEVKPAEVARSTTTGQAARDTGAQVLPTDPKVSVEPTPAAPGSVQPAQPK
jgi:hypothetical protein